MAEVNWDEYARSFGGGGGSINASSPNTQAGQAIGGALGKGFAAIPRVQDKVRVAGDNVLESAMSPLFSLLSKPIEQWGDIGNIPSAGEAFMTWKGSLSPRQSRIAKRQGLLNPIKFKQQYDANLEMYLPEIKKKLQVYQEFNRKNPKQMREFLSDKKLLNKFLLQNTSPQELETTMSYLRPKQTWEGWWGQKSGLDKASWTTLKPAAAAYGAYKGGRFALDVAQGKGLAESAKNVALKSPFGEGKMRMPTDTQVNKAAEFLKKEGSKIGTAAEKRIVKEAKSTAGKQRAATRKLNSAKDIYEQARQKYRGKNVFDVASGKKKPPKGGKFKSFKSTKEGKKLWKAQQVAKKAQDAAKAANITAKSKVGTGAVQGIQRFVKKHGIKGLFNAVAKKAGKRQALKLLGKGTLGAILTPTGLGTAAGVALNAVTAYQLWGILKDIGNEE